MVDFDDDVTLELAQKRNGNPQRRSEAEHRLYWSTFKRKIARQAAAPRWESQLWMRVRPFPGGLRKWWHELAQFVMRVSEEGSRKYPLIPKERRG